MVSIGRWVVGGAAMAATVVALFAPPAAHATGSAETKKRAHASVKPVVEVVKPRRRARAKEPAE